ncbi:MAG: alpha/beta hydrolase family protein [Pseudoclavibacter sp.]
MTTDEHAAIATEPNWVARYRTPHLLTVRPVAGDPDVALVVENQVEQAKGRIWTRGTDLAAQPELPLELGFDALLSRDREWVVNLDDEGGSEVGHLTAHPVAGGEAIDLTPGRPPYVVRGMEFSADGSTFLATVVDDDGFHLLAIPSRPWGAPATVWSSTWEGWYGRISADGAYASIDSTDHNPGIRRTAATVIEIATGTIVGVCDDLPDGPVRAVRWSPVPGDQRVLLNTERSGFARPAIWSPLTGERMDFDLPELGGELLPLDWAPQHERLLLVHIEDGIQRLIVVDADSGAATVVREGTGSYANPDVAAEATYYSQSYFGADGSVLAFEQAWHRPPSLVEIAPDGSVGVAIPAADVPTGAPLQSEMVTSEDGTRVQLWWAIPDGEIRGTVLGVHGGPNLVTADVYSPEAQSWLAEGYAYASLNYRGSVTFGRDFREGFWRGNGDREIADIRAAILRLREHGVADPASTFITGPSYGGHLTLLSLGRLPDMFAGGFAVVAMADWRAAFDDDTMNAALQPVWRTVFSNAEGGFDEAVRKMSSTTYVDRVRGSAWLYQGSRDTRTPPKQAQRYADLLREAGGDVLIEWFDAGHSPDGLVGEEHAQRRMLDLASRTLRGERWSDRA